ncbi:MAG: hypothetical protein EZS28_044180 [Streblomastix strix]|uniref:Uncharacterized protein n=1 Tax=Streblomastix strix TaxID=222440 RepID=A0A5J4TQU2_9EUKA|nr:MAG: hypothetical protein EZS28_044180 [Streblomastix strix]
MTLIRDKDPNSHYNLTRIPDQIIKIVKERICPIIHLNCPPDINCQQYINVPQSSTIIELKSAVFQSLNQVSRINQRFKEILVNDHNIIPHLTHPLIQFASQSQFNKKTDSIQQRNQQQSESSSSISLIASSNNLLYILIQWNNKIYKEVIKTPKVLHSLSTLSIYKIGTHLSQENDQQTLALRRSSRRCLGIIQLRGDVSTHSELINVGYAIVFVIAISTASGSGEEKDEEIWNGLSKISIFLKCLNKGKQNSFPPQPLLARRSYEQFEEEGGNEEIDSQLINNGQQYCNIKDGAIRNKGRILNYFIELGTSRPDWYQQDQDEEYQDQEEEEEEEEEEYDNI